MYRQEINPAKFHSTAAVHDVVPIIHYVIRVKYALEHGGKKALKLGKTVDYD